MNGTDEVTLVRYFVIGLEPFAFRLPLNLSPHGGSAPDGRAESGLDHPMAFCKLLQFGIQSLQPGPIRVSNAAVGLAQA